MALETRTGCRLLPTSFVTSPNGSAQSWTTRTWSDFTRQWSGQLGTFNQLGADLRKVADTEFGPVPESEVAKAMQALAPAANFA